MIAEIMIFDVVCSLHITAMLTNVNKCSMKTVF